MFYSQIKHNLNIIISVITILSISNASPISFLINKCNDSQEYYTNTKISYYNILYSITTYDYNTQSFITSKKLYNNPTFENYLELATNDNNITINGNIFFFGNVIIIWFNRILIYL